MTQDTQKKCYCRDGWICEEHPARPWPHEDCLGPGMPCQNGCQFLPVVGLVPAFDVEHDVRVKDTQTPQQPQWVVLHQGSGPKNEWWNIVRENDYFAEGQLGRPWGNFIAEEWAQQTADRVNFLEGKLGAQQQRIQQLEDQVNEDIENLTQLHLKVTHLEGALREAEDAANFNSLRNLDLLMELEEAKGERDSAIDALTTTQADWTDERQQFADEISAYQIKLREAEALLKSCLGPPYADDLRLLIVGIGGSDEKTVAPAMEIAEALRERHRRIREFLQQRALQQPKAGE